MSEGTIQGPEGHEIDVLSEIIARKRAEIEDTIPADQLALINSTDDPVQDIINAVAVHAAIRSMLESQVREAVLAGLSSAMFPSPQVPEGRREPVVALWPNALSVEIVESGTVMVEWTNGEYTETFAIEIGEA